MPEILKSKTVIGYDSAIEYYLRLSEKAKNGVLTGPEKDFIDYVDKNCYPKSHFGVRPAENISREVQEQVVKLKISSLCV